MGPDGWEAVLGTKFLDVPGGGLLRRDYGLVEINFSPDQPGRQGQMSCFGFGVKVQRLMYDQSPSSVPSLLSRKYGEFVPRVPFKELQAAVLALGHTIELEENDATWRDMDCYRVTGSAARIHVIVDPDPYGTSDLDPDGHQVGDVWSIDLY
ncbi:hypothetical protein OG243_38015 [Streptomyces sp. NBC_01318]|uniref:hypothetical protein n=1 Tax=unclassified Streptomyces TaxID=2593676 RepID=UPI002DDA0D01|nr:MULTISPECIES: hypothetical protein [unclassified Streptomyces]WSC35221.1 hypothetical protein OHA08_06625 [Streptomyces sp. NBC_01763]WSJ54846.1 hypothetical protein OG243_38015 [Streptomyces sp. NBC_01318]